MSPKKFLKKFPDTEPRENCLEDIACPKCGQRDEFVVQALLHVGLRDEGTDAYSDSTKHYGDTDWGPNSFCRCPDCDYEGKVRNFTHEGLDKLIDNAPCPECGGTVEHHQTCGKNDGKEM